MCELSPKFQIYYWNLKLLVSHYFSYSWFDNYDADIASKKKYLRQYTFTYKIPLEDLQNYHFLFSEFGSSNQVALSPLQIVDRM